MGWQPPYKQVADNDLPEALCLLASPALRKTLGIVPSWPPDQTQTAGIACLHGTRWAFYHVRFRVYIHLWGTARQLVGHATASLYAENLHLWWVESNEGLYASVECQHLVSAQQLCFSGTFTLSICAATASTETQKRTCDHTVCQIDGLLALSIPTIR